MNIWVTRRKIQFIYCQFGASDRIRQARWLPRKKNSIEIEASLIFMTGRHDIISTKQSAAADKIVLCH